MSWEDQLSRRLRAGNIYNFRREFKVKLLERVNPNSGILGRGSGIFVRCEIMEDWKYYKKGDVRELNAEYLF